MLKEIPELAWGEQRFVSEGWMKPGQVLLPKANAFSKKGFRRLGVSGEIRFLFDAQRLIDCSFHIEDAKVSSSEGNADWVELYNAVKVICTSPETRDGDGESSSISWKISGENTNYELRLTRRVFGKTVERGLEISVRPKKK